MDDFVRKKLTEWGFSDLIQKFKDEEVDQEALGCLDDHEIEKLISTAGKRIKFKKKLKLFQSQQECQEPAHSAQALPSTSNRSEPVKRKLELRMEENKNQTPNKRQCNTVTGAYEEHRKLGEVKRIMSTLHDRLHHYDRTELNDFLRNQICDLETDKREMVGVFGKTGAGKSSLINAIIGEKHLLPSGSVIACTTVMIQVEANMENQKYEAHIEFITKEEWKDELWSFKNLSGDNGDEDSDNGDEENKSTRDDDEYYDNVEKLTALYGDQWKSKSPENLMEAKYFKDVPEFLQSKKKILSCNLPEELSAKYLKYTRSGSTKENSGEVERCYWPLVKCVTVKVPKNDLLQHVTLVDLPGNGDRNKSRDQMWRRIVGNCSTVWIVAEINRAATETESWEILKSACSLMGNGGECQNIHFICTKTDDIDEDSDADVGRRIFKRNMEAKDKVRQEFNKLKDVKKQFRDDCFTVFTVSAKEFLQKRLLKPEETEIPELQMFLRSLNDQHSETLNYVFGAYGILSLMKAAHCGDAARKTSVCAELMENITCEKEKVRKPMEDAYEGFKKHLHTSVEKSKESCEKALEKMLYRSGKAKCGFHNKLKHAMKNNGIFKPVKKTKKGINMNMTLSSLLSESIDEEFKNAFPNDGNSGPFYGAISDFTLYTEKLSQNYKDVELQLIFLKTEEKKMKAKLCRITRHRKKTIYNSLPETIEETMRECYTRAAEVRGKESLNKMREIIQNHVRASKATMFDLAKDDMLTQLRELMGDILKTLTDTMQRSIELSLKTNDNSIPDVSAEHSKVESYYKELKGPDEETSLLWPDMLDDSLDSPGSAAAAETSDFRFH
ncbi:nuclear GTPase SLIP-GC-like [Sphaeramia orbicularis]|uniref:nuclear GTPase SLIP-GC-like n=1 Tax=Sphaeramia orbicularis TaxID=375764 RepID=UPI0011811AA7|nr:nuclear GTPase SLIP-GC-like [Sphaeramia orbicularis]